MEGQHEGEGEHHKVQRQCLTGTARTEQRDMGGAKDTQNISKQVIARLEALEKQHKELQEKNAKLEEEKKKRLRAREEMFSSDNEDQQPKSSSSKRLKTGDYTPGNSKMSNSESNGSKVGPGNGSGAANDLVLKQLTIIGQKIDQDRRHSQVRRDMKDARAHAMLDISQAVLGVNGIQSGKLALYTSHHDSNSNMELAHSYEVTACPTLSDPFNPHTTINCWNQV